MYFVNLDNYLHHQLNNNNGKLSNLNRFVNPKLADSNGHQDNHHQIYNQQVNSQQNGLVNLNNQMHKSQLPVEFGEQQSAPTDRRDQVRPSNRCFSCFDRITDFVERRLNRQPIYNLIKCFIVLLTIVQFCIFLLAVITYKNSEQAHFYPKHADYFILGTNLANLNALLSTIFYLYSIIGEVWPLLTLMTTLQAFYSIIELLALLTEPIKVQYIYIIFIMLTSLQTFSMLLFVVMLRIKKLQERKAINGYI